MSRLAEQVREFHERFGHPIADKPHVPDEATVRFRLRLIAEEFFELLEASLDIENRMSVREAIVRVRDAIDCQYPFRMAPVKVDLPEFVDALADTMYVLEGTAIAFGVDMAPVIDEVHRANCSKEPNGPDGKPVKPAGWQPPSIAEELRRQGLETQ